MELSLSKVFRFLKRVFAHKFGAHWDIDNSVRQFLMMYTREAHTLHITHTLHNIAHKVTERSARDDETGRETRDDWTRNTWHEQSQLAITGRGRLGVCYFRAACASRPHHILSIEAHDYNCACAQCEA